MDHRSPLAPLARPAACTNGLDRSTQTPFLDTWRPSSSTPVLASASPATMASAPSRPVTPSQDLCRVSTAPATKTTVVTTTTTTTVNFPPFMIKRPLFMRDRDPRQFPLAAKPIPATLRRFNFPTGDGMAVFDEAEDPDEALNQFEAEKSVLAANNGSFTTFATSRHPHTGWPRLKRDREPLARSALPDITDDKARWPLKRRRMDPLGITNGRVTPDRPQTPLQEGVDTPSTLQDDTARQSEPESFPSPIAGPPSPPSFLEAPAMAATPPAADQDTVAYEQVFEDNKRATPSLDTSVARLDASLPSPVYSPVTAAATPSLSELEDNEELFPLERTRAPRLDVALEEDDSPFSAMSNAVDTFDSLPQQLQKYLAFQMLRRSDKAVLQFIAGLVNPALKCDFLARLPLELALTVVGYLDATTLCRAAQVSKKWRQLVDSYDRVWKDLLDKDGYELPAGELGRAIAEGWAWQGAESFEADLSKVLRRKDKRPETPRSDSYAAEPTGSKRKALVQKGAPKKRRVDYETQAENATVDASDVISPDFPRALLPDLPIALESDHPAFGLRSLRVPHLFKAVYRRQHCIRNSWMDQRTEPKHMAFRAHGRHVVTCLQFDDDKILTGSDDTKIHVYETGTGALRTVLDGHEGGVWALQYVGNTLVSGSTDRTVRIWDVERGRCRHVFHGHTSTVRCLVVLQPVQVGVDARGQPIMMPPEPLIITGSRDATLRIWKLPRGDAAADDDDSEEDDEEDESRVRGDGSGGLTVPPADGVNPYFVRALHGHMHSVRSIAAHGDTLVSGSYDSTVRVWRVSTGETVHRLAGHASKVYSVILDHARARCVSGSMDNLVKVWSLETGACLYNLEGHSSLVGLLDLSHGRLVSAAADSTLRVWDPETGHCRNVLAAHTGAITCFQHDGQKVVSGSDRSLKMWDVRTGTCVRDLLTDLSGGWQVRFNDRKCVAAVQRRNRTYIEVLDFGAARDGIPHDRQGVRTVVDEIGTVVDDISDDEEEEE